MQENNILDNLINLTIKNHLSLFDYKKEIEEIDLEFRNLLSSSNPVEYPTVIRKYSFSEQTYAFVVTEVLKKMGFLTHLYSGENDSHILEIQFDRKLVRYRLADRVYNSIVLGKSENEEDLITSNTLMATNSILNLENNLALKVNTKLKEILLEIDQKIQNINIETVFQEELYSTKVLSNERDLFRYICEILNQYGFQTELYYQRESGYYIFMVWANEENFLNRYKENISDSGILLSLK